MNPVKIDRLVFSTTVIRTRITGLARTPSLVGSATGFFYKCNGNKFLVTNRHVVIDEDFHPDHLEIRVHTDPASLTQNRDINIGLYQNQNPKWLEHPTRQDVDVVAIPVNPYIASRDVIHYWSIEDLTPSDATISIGESVIIIGYPMEFYDRMHNLPIVRSGTVASTFGAHFEGKPFFLVDANLHPGTSGSPVIAPTGPTTLTEFGTHVFGSHPTLLLGTNSGEYSKSGVKLGLNAVWYPSLIEEIVTHQRLRQHGEGKKKS